MHASKELYSDAMNPCPTPPVCEFGWLGPASMYWYPPHAWSRGTCMRCGVSRDLDSESNCWPNLGGVYGMCGHRPYTAEELAGTPNFRRGDRMGQCPEVDKTNVRVCDGARR